MPFLPRLQSPAPSPSASAALCRLPARPRSDALPRIDREAVYQKALPTYADDAGAAAGRQDRRDADASAAPACCASPTSARTASASPRSCSRPCAPRRRTPPRAWCSCTGWAAARRRWRGWPCSPPKSGYASLAIDEYGQGERTPAKPSTRSQAEELATTVHQSAAGCAAGAGLSGDAARHQQGACRPGRHLAGGDYRHGGGGRGPAHQGDRADLRRRRLGADPEDAVRQPHRSRRAQHGGLQGHGLGPRQRSCSPRKTR